MSMEVADDAVAPPPIEWRRTYARGATIRDLHATTDGSYIAAGHFSFGGGTPLTRLYMLKTDAAGEPMWERVLPAAVAECEYAFSVRETPDRGYVLFGTGDMCDVGGPTALLVKTDAFGGIEWFHSFPSAGGGAVRVAEDGGYVLAGSRFSDAWLAKTDLNGELEWETLTGSPAIDVVSSVEIANDGGYVGAGFAGITGRSWDMLLFKTDRSGGIEWERNFGGDSADRAVRFRRFVDGGFVLLGESESFGPGPLNTYLVRTDEHGVALWERAFGAEQTRFYAKDVESTPDGGLLVSSWVGESGQRDTCLLKLDASGFPLWEKTIGGEGFQLTQVVAPVRDGGFLLGGSDSAAQPPYFVAVLRKLAPETPPESDFVRGDSTRDGVLDVSDAVRALNWLFLGSVPLHCHDAADTDDDGTISLGDAIVLLNYLYRGGPPPPSPFPDAGLDPTAEDPLGCVR